MKIFPDDRRITAYALNEIEDEVERKEIEAAVKQSLELQEAVADIQGMSDLLATKFAEESAAELSEFEKERLVQSPKKSAKRSFWYNRFVLWPAISSIAAALLVAFVIFNEFHVEYQVSETAFEEPLPSSESFEFADEGDWALSVDFEEPDQALAEVASPAPVQYKAVAPVISVGRARKMPSSQAAFSDSFVERCFSAESVFAQNTEKYAPIEESNFRSPLVAPLSTFSIDLDTASYANIRRFLNQGQLPPADAVRIEELINYFPYADAAPAESPVEGGAPFAVYMTQTTAPWNHSNHLLRVALKGYEMLWEERPASNLVFLLDVSGSMNDPNKLPLVKKAMDMLISRLGERDRVAIVVYAGSSGLVLPSTTANNRETIRHALNHLKAGGSTNGGAGIQLAYKVAREHFIDGGNNRVILCTDGDFNTGQTHAGDLADIAESAAKEGVSLTILGFGMGNYKDDLLEELSNKGKGSYAYVDSETEARKVFLQYLTGNLFKIAKDVKIQVEFNPAQVRGYRLIGYENRRLKAEDFNNDRKEAGDIGPGHTVVALYEIIPAENEGAELPSADVLRYQQKTETSSTSTEVATVKLRYKKPDTDASQLITKTVNEDMFIDFDKASEDVRFSACVAAFGMLLSNSENANEISYKTIESIAAEALGSDPGGYRLEFTGLVRNAREISEMLKSGEE